MATLRSLQAGSVLWKFGRNGLSEATTSCLRDRNFARATSACFKTIKRSYKGSNRDTRRRERNAMLQLKRRVPDPPMEFDSKSFIFQNYDKELLAFQKRLSIEFKNPRYLKAAFVHPSFLQAIKNSTSATEFPSFVEGNMDLFEEYKTLEFLPDKLGLLGFAKTSQIIKSSLFTCYPQFSSFLLEKFGSILCERRNIAALARNIGIPELIVIDYNINEIDNEKHLPFSRDDVVCDAFFAFMGAIYHDMGVEEVQKFVDDFIMPFIDDESFRESFKLKNPVKASTEIAALLGHKFKPESRLIFSAGKNSNVPLYIVGIFSGDTKLGEGASFTMKLAEKAAYEMSVYNTMWRRNQNETLQ